MRHSVVLVLFVTTLLLSAVLPAQKFEFHPGDRAVSVGNALAERMQHAGWLETFVQSTFPQLEVTFRNHGFCGDTVSHRPRNQGFSSADEYLTSSEATVVLAFFGYNESFADDPAAYSAQLGEWIDATRQQRYDGATTPRIVLFTPIACEAHGAAMPQPMARATNTRLARHATATAAVASAKSVAFVDLFAATQDLFARSTAPLTINGIHLTDEGNRRVASHIMLSLFGIDTNERRSDEASRSARIRAAVVDKNWHWFQRYRATDGNDIWGSRGGLAFVDGQTNADVLQHELTMIDVMVANRDARIHAVAAGEHEVAVDDSNVPPPIRVQSNVGGGSPSSDAVKEGQTTYMSPADTCAQLELDEGLLANVFASEQMFPELANPVQLGVDPQGRMWVAAWRTYPKWEPLTPMTDGLLILPDDNRDGVADRAIPFAEVPNPTGFEFWNGGVIVASAPDLWFFQDTDGDDRADVRVRILHGLDSADTHHGANNLTYGPDGGIYYQRGVFHVSNVETPWRAAQEHRQSGMFRFDPRTFEFSFHAVNSPNPHGISFGRFGGHFATDGTGGRAYQVRPSATGGFAMHKLLDHSVRPVASSGILSSAHFPARLQDSFLICNTIGFLGIKRYTLTFDQDGVAQGNEATDLLESPRDRNFRPTDVEIGDDGALYVSDWQNILIGHMQHNVRDPSRDHEFGRIYRITAKGRPTLEPAAVYGRPISELLDLLLDPTDKVGQRARVELSSRDEDRVMAKLDTWLARLNPDQTNYEVALLEGLWLRQRCGVRDLALLAKLLKSADARVRSAARVVQHHWQGGRGSAAPPPTPTENRPKQTSANLLRERGFDDAALELYALGAEVFTRDGHCVTCHQHSGRGLGGIYPSLHTTRWVAGDEQRLIKLTLKGLWGPLTVGGVTYNTGTRTTPPMTGFRSLLDDREVAAVLTYLRNTFGNDAPPVSPATVAKVSRAIQSKSTFYLAEDLLAEHPIEAEGDGPNSATDAPHLVFVTGDEEYRSEESMPALAKILTERHGFRCTVLFAIDPMTGTIDPTTTDNIPGLEALRTADLMVLFTRFRDLPDGQMQHIVDYVESGRPIVALRTATHAFAPTEARKFHDYAWGGRSAEAGFGRQVLGERWVGHHGQHGAESTRGVAAPGAASHPILRGIDTRTIWDPADVYAVRLPMVEGVAPLVLGEDLAGMQPHSPAQSGTKNDPMMPIAWTKSWVGASGKTARVFVTTLGSAAAFVQEGTRRLLVNGCYWALGKEDEIAARSNVRLIDEFEPSPFGFGKERRGVRPEIRRSRH